MEGESHAAHIRAEASFLATLRRPELACAAFAKTPFVLLPLFCHRSLWGEQGEAGGVRRGGAIVIRPTDGIWGCFPSLVLTSIKGVAIAHWLSPCGKVEGELCLVCHEA